MFKKLSLLTVLAIFALLFVACGGGAAEAPQVEEAEATTVVEAEAPAEEPTAEEPAAEEPAAEEPAAEEPAATEAPGETEGPAPAQGADTLAEVQARGILNCGANANLPGFGFVEEDGSFSGFDIDYCRAIAAAVLGDSEAVEYRPLTATERFPVLQSGEIDVLVRNTTWTTVRDTALGFDFAPTTFYDGQGMMVRVDSGITDLEGLEGGTVCVQAGTTTEKNLADAMRFRGVEYEPVVFPDAPSTSQAYDEGRCDGFTTDKSGLVGTQVLLTVPDDHVILDVTMSKEPLGPLVRHGDNNWGDIIRWTVNCTFQAEEMGIDSTNVDEFLGSDDPAVLNMLGVEGDLPQAMGLENDFCVEVIRQVGNYGEIYNRNLGPDTQFDLPRGVNAQWTEGGLIYSPPFK
jgi:general L-amino acid transport system substrate-binding protein